MTQDEIKAAVSAARERERVRNEELSKGCWDCGHSDVSVVEWSHFKNGEGIVCSRCNALKDFEFIHLTPERADRALIALAEQVGV